MVFRSWHKPKRIMMTQAAGEAGGSKRWRNALLNGPNKVLV